jgi:hypothetical protein
MKQREHEVLNKPDCAAKLPKVSSEATLFAVAANRRMSEKILAVFGRHTRGGLSRIAVGSITNPKKRGRLRHAV